MNGSKRVDGPRGPGRLVGREGSKDHTEKFYFDRRPFAEMKNSVKN